MPSDLPTRIDGVKIAAAARTFRQYGLQDLFKEHAIAPSAPGFYGKMVSTGKNIGEMGRDMIFGSPITFGKQLERNYRSTGSAPRALGKYIKDWYFAPNTSLPMRALSLAFPVVGLGSALMAPAERRKEEVLASMAGLATSPFAMRLGSPGMDMQAGIENAVRHGVRDLSREDD